MAVKCPECGSYNATTAETCKKCGTKLIEKSASSDDRTQAQPMKGLLSRLFNRSQTKDK